MASALDGLAACVRFGGLLDKAAGEGVKFRFAVGAGVSSGDCGDATAGAGDKGLPLPSTG